MVWSAFLHFYQIGNSGSNAYYTAAAKSMAASWKAFFFAALDPAGFITVDKPPVAIWPQALSAKVFGVSDFSVLLPEALAADCIRGRAVWFACAAGVLVVDARVGRDKQHDSVCRTGFASGRSGHAGCWDAGGARWALAGRAKHRVAEDGNRLRDNSSLAALVVYLEQHAGKAKYLAATIRATEAAEMMLHTDRAVMAMGGFGGTDPVLTPEKLEQMAQNGEVKYFLLSGEDLGNNELVQWIQTHCKEVPSSQWGGGQSAAIGGMGRGGMTLYVYNG